MKIYLSEIKEEKKELERNILKRAVREEFGLYELPVIVRNEKGKPYFEDKGLPYFNISHSGDYLVVVVSDVEVGIDIQEVGDNFERSLKTARRFFSKEEAEEIERIAEEVSAEVANEYFFRLWTRKESYGKCLGAGVNPVISEDMRDTEKKLFDGFVFTEEPAPEGYMITVCERKAN